MCSSTRYDGWYAHRICIAQDIYYQLTNEDMGSSFPASRSGRWVSSTSHIFAFSTAQVMLVIGSKKSISMRVGKERMGRFQLMKKDRSNF